MFELYHVHGMHGGIFLEFWLMRSLQCQLHLVLWVGYQLQRLRARVLSFEFYLHCLLRLLHGV